MTVEKILVGTTANDRTGDTWRDAMIKTNKIIPTAGDVNTYAVSAVDELVKTADLDISFQWTFSDSTVDSDPGAGFFRLNNADPALATFIFLSTNPRPVAVRLPLPDRPDRIVVPLGDIHRLLEPKLIMFHVELFRSIRVPAQENPSIFEMLNCN